MCARLCVWIGLTNIIVLMNPCQYKFYFFLDLLYGITHGIDITLDLLLMAWNFKDILRIIFFQICIGNTHCLYNFYFTHNVALTELVFSYG